jgi:hypothetical protein
MRTYTNSSRPNKKIANAVFAEQSMYVLLMAFQRGELITDPPPACTAAHVPKGLTTAARGGFYLLLLPAAVHTTTTAARGGFYLLLLPSQLD